MSAGSKGAKKLIEKIVHGKIRTDIPSGMAAAGPPLGPQLGQRGLNIAAFCKDFNNKTAHYVEGVPLPTRVVVNPDRSYKLTIHNPTVSFLIKQAAGIQRGSMSQGNETAGWITLKHVYDIALIKAKDPPNEIVPLKQICEQIVGSAHSCGIEVRRDYDPVEYGEFLTERRQLVEAQLQELRDAKEAKLLRK